MGTLLANLNSGETASGKMVLRQDADADLLDALPIAKGKLIKALLLQITQSGAAVTLEVIPSA